MHAVFIPYGSRHWVENFLRAIEAEYFKFPLYKGKQKKTLGIYGAVRSLPFGAYEVIFPREYKDLVLTTLNFHHKAPYIKTVFALRKMFKCKKVGKFNSDKKYMWDKQWVSIIPIGIREDGEFTDPSGENKGWSHEGL